MDLLEWEAMNLDQLKNSLLKEVDLGSNLNDWVLVR